MDRRSTFIIIALIVILAFVTLMSCGKKKDEGYSNPSDMDNIGSVDVPPPQQDMEYVSEGYSAPSENGLPKVPLNVTPYNIDVADPQTYSFATAPRVVLKPPQLATADMYRGDLLIKNHPDIPLVSRTQYDRSDIFTAGLFSQAHNALYNKYTNRSMPLNVSTQTTIMDM